MSTKQTFRRRCCTNTGSSGNRVLEARMGKKGNREYVQVLRLLSFLTLAAVTGWVEIFQYACAGIAEHYNLGLRMSATGLE